MKELVNKVGTFAKRNFWWIIAITVLLEVMFIRDMCNREIINYLQTVIELKDKEIRTMDNYQIEIDTISGIGSVTRIYD